MQIGVLQDSGCTIHLVDNWAVRGTDWQSSGTWKIGMVCLSIFQETYTVEKELF